MGKPRIPGKDGGDRDRLLTVRVSEAEYAYIQALAAEHGLSMSDLIRDCLLADMTDERTN